MESRPDLESQKPTPQVDSPHDSESEDDLALKPQFSNAYGIPTWHKCLILFIVSWMTLAVTFSSTSLLPAIPEIATEFSTTSEILNVTNAGVLIAMGFSSFIWGPVTHLFGRRNAYNAAILVLCACSAGTAAAINLHMFIAMRILGGFTGTFFMVAGQTILADIFEPTVRGTAVGCFMVGSVSGPAIGPCIGGIIVTFSQWRIIYWLQFAMTLLGLVLSLLFVPSIQEKNRIMDSNKPWKLCTVLSMFNPLRIFRQFVYPNIFLACLTCGLLSTFQYALLTSARSIFNPRFNLTTPLISGLFYLSPGIGFLIGSVVGGRLSDHAVKKWILKRNGKEVGGMAVPIIAAFFAGAGLIGAFNGLNTYSAEVMPHVRSEVISAKYVVQYIFAAAATAAVEPVISAIGVGWTFTICVLLHKSKSKKVGTPKKGYSLPVKDATRIKLSVPEISRVVNVAQWDSLMNVPTLLGIVRSEAKKYSPISYLDQLLAENQRLKERSITSAQVTETNDPLQRGPSRTADVPDGTGIQNPLIGDRAWFHRYDPSSPPIYIGEAACSAFATRFRRFLSGNSAMPHIPRTQYEREETIAAANEADIQWPSLHHARLLVRIAIHQIGHLYHLMMRKSTLDKLEEIYQTQDFDCTASKCKFFALFAFGQAYSIRSEPSSGSRVPGTSYFARAMGLVQILPERTSVTHLETLLLLSLFSYYLNRRHSAYILIGNAMRMGLTIGLNHNILESQLIDPVERQHRIQIWWTIYIFDRMWGSKMGLPMQILDEDIHVDMPSTISPEWRHGEELSDSEYMTANIKLARIVGETITKLYSRRKYQETFLQRVQKLLKSLKHWVETLPESLRLNMEDLESSKKPVVSLHMAFNQCVILTTRPTLLHLLMTLSKKSKTANSTSGIGIGIGTESSSEDVSVSQPVLTLSEACIHAARHSHSMILTRWINGSMPTFGYFHAHYLFSSALILAMSSFVPIGSPTDMTGFDSALDLLRSMTENGNLAAAEFYHNLEQVKACLAVYQGARHGDGSAEMAAGGVAPNINADASGNAPSRGGALALSGPSSDLATATTPFLNSLPLNPSTSTSTSIHPPSLIPATHDILASATTQHAHSHGINAYPYPLRDTVSGYTTEMAFLEPTMQDFLAQSDIDLGLLHPVDTFFNEAENLYTCHEF
ncbi:Major facilitator superfamily domain, general substrate transporter [Penicillium griseofulvum]|uniref:Major facilitator superfamily domain, general substrate transporter n=1 Tax=Penicillium patulum TaxID=5078 RepID=A0A135LQ35_PENPA|nr:Major facilitator superfamily domain, general substrate transporter [Penicillium griseofulvum]KXG51070.1 Major facilitator superfamily domain, general substrate transporter [Penicillium griseofulvum]